MNEVLTMTTQELDKLRIIRQVLERKLTWADAAKQLNLTQRQIGRLCVRVRQEGNRGIIHRLRNRPSNHRLPVGLMDKAVELVGRRYPDFGPTFANEKLHALHRISISTSSLRRGLIASGRLYAKPRKAKHRTWRPRRQCIGELVQLDGSDHDWFETRGPRCVLLAYIDDASSRILHGEFIAVEDTEHLLRATKLYLKQHGRPLAFYVDKDSIYKVNRQATIEEQLKDTGVLTQFTRAMEELRIEMIYAQSPQAKGRVERSFRTHQDRLVKELRLARISSTAEANQFLWQQYIPQHNARYAVEPANTIDAHRPLRRTHDLEAILSIQTLRRVEQDFTLRLQNRFFQLEADQPVRVRPKDRVLIEQRLDGSMRLRYKGRYLSFHPIPKRPQPRVVVMVARPMLQRRRQAWRPSSDHPYKRRSYQAMQRCKAAKLSELSKP